MKNRSTGRLRTALASIIFAASPFLTASRAIAAEHWIISTIKGVYPQADGTFVLTFNTQYGGPGCTNVNQYFFVSVGHNSVTADGIKGLLAASLAAAAQHQSVQVAFDDADTTYCWVNRIWVSY